MKMTNKTKLLSIILCLVLTWTAALITGCKDDSQESPEPGSTTAVVTTTEAAAPGTSDAAQSDAVTEVGEGNTVFDFTVTDADGNETVFRVKTDKTVVGDALSDVGLIEGEDGQYGLYVKKVNGILADYDTDGTYWAFYVNGEYAMTGVDTTDIVPGDSYAFKVEK